MNNLPQPPESIWLAMIETNKAWKALNEQSDKMKADNVAYSNLANENNAEFKRRSDHCTTVHATLTKLLNEWDGNPDKQTPELESNVTEFKK